jgi:hypothetical protein
MPCTDHQRLLEEERRTWAAYHDLERSGHGSEKQLVNLGDIAHEASKRLRRHIEGCAACKEPTVSE